MKKRWVNFVKDYLTFSKKERRGIFVIFLLCLLAFFISRYFPVTKKHLDPGAFQKELTQLKISIDTSHNAYAYQHEDIADYTRPKHYGNYETLKAVSFPFDPNTLDAAGWKRLGLKEK